MFLATLMLIALLQPMQDERFEAALAEMQEGRYAVAADQLDKLLADDPKSATAYELRGHCRHQLGQLELAIADFDAALVLDAKRPGSHCARGMLLRLQGELLEAAQSYGRAIRLEPKFLEALNWRGLTFVELGQTTHAIEDFTTSLGVEPNDPWVRMRRAEAYIVQRQFMEAGVDLIKAHELAPDDWTVSARLGTLLAVGGNPRGLELLQEAQKKAYVDDGLALWVWLARREAGHPARAVDGDLSAWTMFSSDRSWSLSVGSYLTGRLSAEDLPASVIDAEQSRAKQSLSAAALDCRVAFFRGAGHQLNGRVRGDVPRQGAEVSPASVLVGAGRKEQGVPASVQPGLGPREVEPTSAAREPRPAHGFADGRREGSEGGRCDRRTRRGCSLGSGGVGGRGRLAGWEVEEGRRRRHRHRDADPSSSPARSHHREEVSRAARRSGSGSNSAARACGRGRGGGGSSPSRADTRERRPPLCLTSRGRRPW